MGACLCCVCWLQDAAQLVDLTTAAADQYSACMADLEQLASCSYPSEAAPQQLRALEAQLRERLEVCLCSRLGWHGRLGACSGTAAQASVHVQRSDGCGAVLSVSLGPGLSCPKGILSRLSLCLSIDQQLWCNASFQHATPDCLTPYRLLVCLNCPGCASCLEAGIESAHTQPLGAVRVAPSTYALASRYAESMRWCGLHGCCWAAVSLLAIMQC